MNNKKINWHFFTINVTPEMHAQIKDTAKKLGIPTSRMVRSWIEKELSPPTEGYDERL